MLRAIGIPKSPRAEAAEERGFGEKNYLSIGIGFHGRLCVLCASVVNPPPSSQVPTLLLLPRKRNRPIRCSQIEQKQSKQQEKYRWSPCGDNRR
jgi:hypothetical protein